MNFNLLLKDKQLLEILHYVLTNEKTKNNVSDVSINKEEYAYNQYSLLITMDIVIKYQIIINDSKYNTHFLEKLANITKDYINHKDLIIKGNALLVNLVSQKLYLSLNKTEDKKEIIRYIYDRYIVNGYCFHSFPSVYKKTVEENGLTQVVDYKETSDLKRINYIFNKHNYKNIITRDLESKSKAIYITDSPAMAYYYAFRSPEYLANLTSLSKYYKNINNYDKNAFYEKNYSACKFNLENLCQHVNMTEKEETTVLKTFDKRWHSLNMTNSSPSIAFIKRENLAKDTLKDIEEIIEEVDKIDLSILISKITDSRYKTIRRYSEISSLDLTVITMPSYREIKNNQFLESKKYEKTMVSENLKKVEETKPNLKFSYSYGNANVVALLGLLLISLGLTISIIVKILGG